MSVLPIPWTAPPPPEVRGGAVTVGNFDGVHRGHRDLVTAARAWADAHGGPAVAVTFDPPPVALLAPGRGPPPLSTLADRAGWLTAAGADHVVVLRTDVTLLNLSPEAFFDEIVVGRLAARAVAEGYNFRFGRGRAGDTALLRRLCERAGVAFTEVPPHTAGGEPVSSSRVRAALAAGDVAAAADLLGRPYVVAGTVVGGAQRGRTIGFPTANLGGVATLFPLEGVYAGRATVDGQTRPAAVNLGPNPTFGEAARKLEVHLLDFAGDLYGRVMSLQFVARLRSVRPFSGPDDLVSQLKLDVAEARVVLGGRM